MTLDQIEYRLQKLKRELEQFEEADRLEEMLKNVGDFHITNYCQFDNITQVSILIKIDELWPAHIDLNNESGYFTVASGMVPEKTRKLIEAAVQPYGSRLTGHDMIRKIFPASHNAKTVATLMKLL